MSFWRSGRKEYSKWHKGQPFWLVLSSYAAAPKVDGDDTWASIHGKKDDRVWTLGLQFFLLLRQSTMAFRIQMNVGELHIIMIAVEAGIQETRSKVGGDGECEREICLLDGTTKAIVQGILQIITRERHGWIEMASFVFIAGWVDSLCVFEKERARKTLRSAAIIRAQLAKPRAVRISIEFSQWPLFVEVQISIITIFFRCRYRWSCICICECGSFTIHSHSLWQFRYIFFFISQPTLTRLRSLHLIVNIYIFLCRLCSLCT